MARLRRIVIPGQVHVIVHRGHNGQPVFVDEQDHETYLSSLRDAARDAGVAVHAYGLFWREVRLLVTPKDEAGLGRMMQSIGRRFVRIFNQRHVRTGTPWEGRFRSAVIEAGPHFPGCTGADVALVEDPHEAATNRLHHAAQTGFVFRRHEQAHFAPEEPVGMNRDTGIAGGVA